MVKFNFVSKSGKNLGSLESNQWSTVGELKLAAAGLFKVDIHRVRLTFEDKLLESSERPLSAFMPAERKEVTIIYKDLGPQISWRSVFLIEYFGPIAISVLMYYLAPVIHRQPDKAHISKYQQVNILLFILHFVKRELETLFVHKFSTETMPIGNLFRNSLYYYVFAVFVNYYLTHPLYTKPSFNLFAVGLTLFSTAELLNGYCHWKLSSLRPSGTKVRQVPRGIFFDHIVAPNYTFEVLAWVGFTLTSGLLVSGLFALASAGILASWATAKKNRYVKEFDGFAGRDLFPRTRWVIFPGLY